MVLLSVTGVVRTVLIIIAVFVILRFFGRLMVAKRNYQAEQQDKQRRDEIRRAKVASEKNKGKVRIVSDDVNDVEDVDFEEIN